MFRRHSYYWNVIAMKVYSMNSLEPGLFLYVMFTPFKLFTSVLLGMWFSSECNIFFSAVLRVIWIIFRHGPCIYALMSVFMCTSSTSERDWRVMGNQTALYVIGHNNVIYHCSHHVCATDSQGFQTFNVNSPQQLPGSYQAQSLILVRHLKLLSRNWVGLWRGTNVSSHCCTN